MTTPAPFALVSTPDPTTNFFVANIAQELAKLLRPEIARLMDISRVKPELLTVEEAGVYLGRTKCAVEHLIHDKELPVVRRKGVRLRRSDLDAWIEKYTF